MDSDGENNWQRKDAWLGVLFLAVGALVSVYAYLAMRNEMPIAWWGAGWLVGPSLVFLGGNAVFRSLGAGRSDRSDT